MAEIKFCKLGGNGDLIEQIKKNAKPTTEAVRRKNWEQAIASARIEGFEPDAEYLANVEKNILGELTDEEFREKYTPHAKTASSRA